MTAVSPREVLARVSQALPETVRENVVVVGSLAAGYHLLALPSPFAKGRALHVLLANSPLQLHDMTKIYRTGLPAFAVFRGDEIIREGHFPIERFVLVARE